MEIISEINNLSKIIGDVHEHLLKHKTLLFYGEMGAGKTTFIAELVRQTCGTNDASSPTYSIVNQYTGNGKAVYHMDLYRLKNLQEALDAGIEDILYSGAYCFIEWPEIILPLIEKPYLELRFSFVDNQHRKIDIIEHP